MTKSAENCALLKKFLENVIVCAVENSNFLFFKVIVESSGYWKIVMFLTKLNQIPRFSEDMEAGFEEHTRSRLS